MLLHSFSTVLGHLLKKYDDKILRTAQQFIIWRHCTYEPTRHCWNKGHEEYVGLCYFIAELVFYTPLT